MTLCPRIEKIKQCVIYCYQLDIAIKRSVGTLAIMNCSLAIAPLLRFVTKGFHNWLLGHPTTLPHYQVYDRFRVTALIILSSDQIANSCLVNLGAGLLL